MFLKWGAPVMLDNNYILHMLLNTGFLPLVLLPKVAHICWNKIDEIIMEKMISL